MITPVRKQRPDTGPARRGDNMALLTVDGRQQEDFPKSAYRPDGQLNIPSQAAADAMREEFLAFEAAESARLEQGNPNPGDPFPQRGVEYLSGPREGTVPTLQEMAQYEDGQLRQDAIDSGVPRADPAGYIAPPTQNNKKPLSNYGFSFGNRMFKTVGALAKSAIAGEGTAESALSSWDKYAGGKQAAYLLGGANDLSTAAITGLLGAMGYGAGAIAEQVPFQSENEEDRLARDLLAMPEALDPLYAQVGALAPIARYGRTGFAQAPYEAGQGVNVVRGGALDAENLGPTGKPLTAVLPDGRRIESREIANIARAEKDYLKSRGLPTESEFDVSGYPELDERRAQLIAAAYQEMKNDPTNPAVRASYEAMVEETLAQLRGLEQSGIDFKFATPDRPYPYEDSPAEGYEDMLRNKQLYVFPTEEGYGTGALFDASGNPLLRPVGKVGDKGDAVANDAFRVVHDAYGHYGPGNPQFRSKGEERAWLRHSRMYSPDAIGAMTSETRGQNSWVNSGPYGKRNRNASGANTVYADQKAGLMPDWTYDPVGMPDGAELRRLKKIVAGWRKAGK